MSRIFIASLMLSVATLVGCENSTTTTTTNPGTHTVKKVTRPDGTTVTREREVKDNSVKSETEINTPGSSTTITREKETTEPAGKTEIELPNRTITIEKKDTTTP